MLVRALTSSWRQPFPAICRLRRGDWPVLAGVDRAIVVERRATVVSVDVVDGAPVRAGQQLMTVYTIGDSLAVATALNTMQADAKELGSVRARDGAGAATTLALLARVAKDRQALTELKLSPTKILAPVAGRISVLAVRAGAELTRTNVVMHVVNDSTLLVTVPLAAAYRTVVGSGHGPSSNLPRSGRGYDAAVVGIGPSATVDDTVGVTKKTSDSTTDETVPVTVRLTKPTPAVAAWQRRIRFVPVRPSRSGVRQFPCRTGHRPTAVRVRGDGWSP